MTRQLVLPLKLPIIPLEGIDGCGKTTMIKRLQDDSKRGLFEACFTREPGGSVVGEKIRDLLLKDQDTEDESPLTRLFLFMASRASNINKVAQRALQEGKIVVSDRLDASTYAFQLWGGECRELEQFFYQSRNAILQSFPIQYIYLRITPEVAAVRRAKRPESTQNFLDRLPLEFHQRVFLGYEEFFGRMQRQAARVENPEHIVHVVDASVSEDEVYNQVRGIVLRAWGSQTP